MKIYASTIICGFGNQLFIIFNTIGRALNENCYYSISLGHRPIFKDITGRNRYSNKQILVNLMPNLKLENFEKMEADSNVINLHGYLQELPKEYIFQEICNTTGIRKYQDTIKIKHAKLLENELISIHFRHGDYIKWNYSYCIKEHYYIKCIDRLCQIYSRKNLKFLIFYEHEEESVIRIIDILKQKYEESEFIIVDSDLIAEEQLILQSLCSHNIIANSTYSLWGALLNMNKDAYIFAPSNINMFSIKHVLHKSNIDCRKIIEIRA